MEFIPLYSSSHGNAYILREEDDTLLLECGVTFPKLQKSVDFGLSRIAAGLITHEHKDHSLCWKQLVRSGIPLYATEGTARALVAEDMTYDGLGPFQMLDGDMEAGKYSYDLIRIRRFAVRPFHTFHDAAEPVGFYIRSDSSGESLVFAIDTANLAYRWEYPPTIVAIESNFIPEVLNQAQYLPGTVRERISHTHMSIERACRFLKELDKSQLREVYLMHLSDATSSEGLFRKQVTGICGGRVKVTICPREPA